MNAQVWPSSPSAAATSSEGSGDDAGCVVVRYWAAAREAAGRTEDRVAAGSVAEALDAVRALHGSDARFEKVLAISSLLVGEQPLGSRDPQEVALRPGDVVEVLPPFAGG